MAKKKSKKPPPFQKPTAIIAFMGVSFYSVGFGGAMAGKRVDLMVLDDLIKNDDEANSEVIQEKLFQTYGSVTKPKK
jgi:hypothetical protein